MENEKVYTKKILREYCVNKKVSYTETELELWSQNLVEISYSIGGYPSEDILKKMIPVYIKKIASRNED